MKNSILFYFLLLILFSSCVKENTSTTVQYPGYKVDSAVFCPGTPQKNQDVLIFFDRTSFITSPNTWYKTEFNWWYKTGSDISVVNAPVSQGVLETPYSKSCQ